jgi:hypothetical protein
MGEQYSQTLISRSNDFVPSAAKVAEFLATIVELGVVPANPSILLLAPTGRTREFKNPFSGETTVHEIKKSKKLDTLDQFEEAAAALHDYDVVVSAMGTPTLPPIPIDFTEPYYVGVTCFVSSRLRSTSDDHDESPDVVSYGEPCNKPVKTGIFSNPDNLELIEVPDAGSARFWVEFELGKSLFPEITGGNLNLLNPPIVEAARTVFGVPFVQGCCWG